MDKSHNAFIKFFASRGKERETALKILEDQGIDLLPIKLRLFILNILKYVFNLKGGEKKMELTIEKAREM
ncbi:hypothetical protein GMMP1_1160002 [Candidatus Magnetomoraceae bacterium gMMP-1]